MRKRILLFSVALIASLILAWFAYPPIRCLAGQCTPASSQPRPVWCCNQGKLWFSLPATVYCARRYAVNGVTVSCQRSGSSCVRNNIKSDIYCENSNDCNVTGAAMPARLGAIVSSGRYYYKGSCVLQGNQCVLQAQTNADIQNCCVKGNPDPGPTPTPGGPPGGGGSPTPTPTPVCIPEFAPPDFGDKTSSVEPPYPLVISQAQFDTTFTGFTFRTGAILGGIDIKCGTGQRATITGIDAQVLLSDQARQGIQNLRQRYYEAKVKGVYPVTPPFTTSGIGTIQAMITSLTYTPVDPGGHIIRVTVTQSDGQQASNDYLVQVWLQDNALSQP